ncbi:MAG: LacI family transcriptional regulator [Spirochaetia bacterium]|nr:LacI family transcriptional regulator [Spirochaetia bacterium]MCF7953332.1 LacI family transcriptional regulator [Spirochaetales bacterium]
MSSIKEIAKFVGISPASVSIYLNDRDTNRVSSDTKKRIDTAVEELNYHKNVFASSLSSQQSKLIGIIIPTMLPLFQNDYTNSLLAGVQSKLSEQGYGMLFFPSSGKSSIEIVKEQLEKSAGCDGYILFSTGFCTMTQIQKNIDEVIKTGKPFVTLNVPPVEKKDVNQVLIDGLKAATGLQHLIELGHRDILVVLGRKGGVHTRYLRDDARKRLAQAGLSSESGRLLYGEYHDQTAYNAVKAGLEKYPRATGICCMSDIMGAAAVKSAQDLGYSVPEDISVIGRNNSRYSRLTTPALTTIDLHMNQAGISTANLLLDALSGNSAAQKLDLRSSLVVRESSGPCPQRIRL